MFVAPVAHIAPGVIFLWAHGNSIRLCCLGCGNPLLMACLFINMFVIRCCGEASSPAPVLHHRRRRRGHSFVLSRLRQSFSCHVRLSVCSPCLSVFAHVYSDMAGKKRSSALTFIVSLVRRHPHECMNKVPAPHPPHTRLVRVDTGRTPCDHSFVFFRLRQHRMARCVGMMQGVLLTGVWD